MSGTIGKNNSIVGPGGVHAQAALYWVDDQYLFEHVATDGARQVKFLGAASLREAFVQEPVDSGWLPHNVARCGVGGRGAWMVRWHEPAVYSVRIAGRTRPLRIPLPSLVWFGQGTHYYIWAAREKKFSPKAALYCAPVANVNRLGLICFGQNAHPDVGKGGFDKAWETFWQAPFNQDHDDGKSKKFPRAINDQLRLLARTKATQYPLNDLVSMHATLERAIKRLTNR